MQALFFYRLGIPNFSVGVGELYGDFIFTENITATCKIVFTASGTDNNGTRLTVVVGFTTDLSNVQLVNMTANHNVGLNVFLK